MLEIADPIATERSQDKLVRRLCEVLSDYLDQNQIDECVRAFEFGDMAHAGQVRKSGEDYICHPISVAMTLAERAARRAFPGRPGGFARWNHEPCRRASFSQPPIIAADSVNLDQT